MLPVEVTNRSRSWQKRYRETDYDGIQARFPMERGFITGPNPRKNSYLGPHICGYDQPLYIENPP